MSAFHSTQLGNHVKDLTGQRFGRLIALEIFGRNRGYLLWKCSCDCGNSSNVASGQLLGGITKSCGCLQKEVGKKYRFKDLTGQVFGRLTVLVLDGFRNHNSFWKCQCECGNETVVFGGSLNYGSVQSCGCLRKEVVTDRVTKHGHFSKGSHSFRSYGAWQRMTSRCTHPSDSSFCHYGAKGVSVCERWRVFENFLGDMGECPQGMSLDRIDNEKGYEPGNCRWADIVTQNRNKRTVKKYEYQGKVLTLPEWSEMTGIPRARLWQRVNVAQWPIEKVLTTPLG